MRIRAVEVSDAAQFLQLSQTLDRESTFMLYEPGERQLTIDEQKEALQSIVEDTSKHLIVAEDGETLVGFVMVIGNGLKRISHRAAIVIGILSAYQGKGLGRKLLAAAEKKAKESGVHRLELTVMAQNKRALWLYSRSGFNVEGIRRKAIKLEESFMDEFYMSKMISTE
ncbi:GCN5 family N-acetyltransferase [Pullulanibacillus camelliae]|uniref:GCN5 family N-acetyltransferase n=1 Tax=Pullulanibacillus camelliae TaxID=1707096 RepID=A0A8J2VNY5_9BACL|nr:GNAT family N-acetyltransferase [Pullulanibacillus camelliae]GGE41097.1 GCN5 family N-acetyltransferase [Pullulanibacillus camelliae]